LRLKRAAWLGYPKGDEFPPAIDDDVCDEDFFLE
jgi:hypothetical protein